MKTLETIEDPRLETGTAQFEMATTFQERPLVISGMSEAVLQVARKAPAVTHVEAVEQPVVPKVAQVPEQPHIIPYEGSKAAKLRLKARFLDILYSDNTYDELVQRQRDERRLANRRALGLVGLVYCQKHEKELARTR